MGSFLKDLIKSEPHSLDQVRESLELALVDRTELLPLLKRHHDFLEESISVIMDKDAADGEKQNHLFRFFRLVEMHGKAEEEVLYTELRANSNKLARLEGYGGQDEHDVAFQLETELLQMGYRNVWNEEIAAKGKVAASLVQNHIKEEESMMFPIADANISAERLDTLRISYVEKCKIYLAESAITSVNHPVSRAVPLGGYESRSF